jgi:endonuclease G
MPADGTALIGQLERDAGWPQRKPSNRVPAIGTSYAYLPHAASAFATQTKPSRCDGDYPAGAAPVITDTSPQVLCYNHYAVGYSSQTLTPLWSAEYLTGADTLRAAHTQRDDDFHADPALAGSPRGEPSDYRHSGYDRGHMTPSGDMPDARSQDESFSLANIVPQNRDNNRHIWSDIEMTVRRLARADDAIFVVTGPIMAPRPALLHHRVAIPVAFYKAIYVPGQGAAAYLSNNVSARNWRTTTIAALVAVDQRRSRTPPDLG